MIEHIEHIPPANPHRQFPGGDVSARETDKAGSMFAELTGGDREDQLNRLKIMRQVEIGHWRSTSDQEANYGSLKYLCDAWGNACSTNYMAGGAMAFIGCFSTLAFMHKGRLLPTKFNDFSAQLTEMAGYSKDEVKFFADQSWSLMRHSHPALYDATAPFIRHLAELNGVESTEELLVVLDASAALPYLMASTTRMEGYLPNALTRVDNGNLNDLL